MLLDLPLQSLELFYILKQQQLKNVKKDGGNKFCLRQKGWVHKACLGPWTCNLLSRLIAATTYTNDNSHMITTTASCSLQFASSFYF